MSRIIITLPQLAQAISRTTNISVPEAEKFIVALVEEISARLAEREYVDIPGLGVFAIGDLDNSTVVWKPSDELEQEVNAPFAFFEPVELAGGVSEKDLDGDFADNVVTEPESDRVPVYDEEQESEYQSDDIGVHMPADEGIDNVQNVDDEDGNAQSGCDDVPEAIADNVDDEVAYTDDSTCITDVEQTKRGRFGWIELLLGMSIGLVIGFVAAIYTPNPQLRPLRNALSGKVADETPDSLPITALAELETESVPADTASAVADSVRALVKDAETGNKIKVDVPAEKFDKVTSSRFLTTMARQYYGDYHFWIYIYMYNKDVINDPDRIPAGTTVKIPDASLYGIDANSPQSIAKAQSLIESMQKEH